MDQIILHTVNDDEYVSFTEAAKILGRSFNYIHGQVQKGAIQRYYFKHLSLLRKEEVIKQKEILEEQELRGSLGSH